MDKIQFKEFCKKDFESRGFKKTKKMFYLKGEELLCGIDLQKSNYGDTYYVNFVFFIGKYDSPKDYPTYYDGDIYGRVRVMTKTLTDKGKPFISSLIRYEEYTEEELQPYFDQSFEERVLPPIYQGKKYILDNLGKLYRLDYRTEEVMEKLQSYHL